MSDTQFNALLDFGDSVPAGNGTTQQSGTFDPFDASPTIDVKGSAGSDLLADFSFDSQVTVQKNGTHNDTDLLGINTSNNVNPLYELSNSSSTITSEPVNPLYNMEEVSMETQKQEVSASASGNPLYDFMSNEETNGHNDNSMDLMGTSATISSDDSGVTMETGITLETGIAGESSLLIDEEESGIINEVAENITNEEQEDEAETVSATNGVHVIGETESDQQGEVTLGDDRVEVIESQNDVDIVESADDVKYVERSQIVESVEEQDSAQEPEQDLSKDQNVTDVMEEPPKVEVLQEEDSPQQEETASQEEEEFVQQEEVDGTEDQVKMDQEVEEQTTEQVEAPVETEPVPAEPEAEPEQNQVDEPETVQEQVDQEPEVQHYEPDPEPVPQEPEIQQFEPEPHPEPEKVTEEPVHATADDEGVQDDSAMELEEQVTFKSTSFICLTPSSPQSPSSSILENLNLSSSSDAQPTEKPQPVVTPKKEQPPAAPVQTEQSRVVQNGLDQNVAMETKEKEEVRFDEMSSIKTKFESNQGGVVTSSVNVQDEILTVQGGEYENQPETFEQWQNTTEGGVYENQPQENPDVVKEDRRIHGEELPEEGMAKNILNKFKQIQEDDRQFKKELTPPDRASKSEYVSEPRTFLEKPTEKIEAGVFESQPDEPEDVVRSGDALEEVLPEKGKAQSLLAKFKQYESEVGDRPPPSPGVRELTPDKNTKGEYVSEPRTVLEQYEGKVESGTFESQPEISEDIIRSGEALEESLPEKGTALNLVSRFKQFETQSSSPPAPRTKKELTPDRYTKGEYVSEPRGFIETYEGKSEAGVFESQPKEDENVVKSGEEAPEILPEAGYAKNLAAKFREIEKSGGSSPTGTPQRLKEVTPPREEIGKGRVAGVLENTPEERDDVVKSSDVRIYEEELPERGMAKNMLNKFKEIQSSQSPTSPRQKKEFTPPPDKGSGVYENTPTKSLEIELVQAESGVLESTPRQREDVAKEGQYSEGDTVFPESGFAKNMVNKWKQIESESGKGTPSPKYKEFTPPREDPRTPGRHVMSPKSPAGANSSVQPNDLPGQYHEQVSAGVYENEPEFNEGIIKETDTDWAEGMPAKDTTKSLLQRFKSIQEQAKEAEKTPEPVTRKEPPITRKSPASETTKMFDTAAETNDDGLGVQGVAPTKRSSFMPNLEKCETCQKAVYAMERLEYKKSIFHKKCFKCSKCSATLTPKTFSINSGTLFCTTHYKQLFARKGNYDEGFGRQQHKKKWAEGEDGQNHVANGN